MKKDKITFKKAILPLMLANQLAMATETEVVLNAGALSINDIGSASADDITLSMNGANLRIVNTVAGMTVSGIGVVEIDPNTAEVPVANITTSVTLNNTEQLLLNGLALTGTNLSGNGVTGLTINGALNASVVTFNNLNSSLSLNDNTINCQTLTLSTSGGPILTNASTTIDCNDINLNATDDVHVQGMINSQNLAANAGFSGDVILSNTQNTINFITTSSNRFNISGQTIGVIGGLTAAGAANIENKLVTNSATALNGTISINGTSDLLIEATGGDVTQTGSITADQLSLGGQNSNITLTGANDINSLTTPIQLDGSIGFNDINGVDLAGVDNTGDLTINAGAAVTDSATNTVTGLTSIVATGVDFTLDESGNNFSGGISLTGAHVSILNLSDLILSDTDLSGNLTINVNGDVSQLNNSVISASQMNAVASGHDIILDGNNSIDNGFNAFGVNITMVESDLVLLGAVTASGNLQVTSVNSGIIDTAIQTISVAGETHLQASIGYNVSLNQNMAGHSLSGLVNAQQGRNVSINANNNLNIGSVNATGALNLTSVNSVFINAPTSQLNVTGPITIQAPDQINIDAAGSDWLFSGLSPTSSDITIINHTNSMSFGSLNANSGNGNIILGGVNITQTDPELSANELTISATGDVLLNQVGNQINALTVNGDPNQLTLNNNQQLTLGDIDVGSLTLDNNSSDVIVDGTITINGMANSRMETTGDVIGTGSLLLNDMNLEMDANIINFSNMEVFGAPGSQFDLSPSNIVHSGNDVVFDVVNINNTDFNSTNTMTQVNTQMNLNAGFLFGDGVINGPVVVNSGGAIATDFSSEADSLTTGDLFVAEMGLLRFAQDSDIFSIMHDQIVVNGSVTLDSASDFQLSSSYVLNRMDEIVLVNNDGADAVIGGFLNKPESAIISSGPMTGRITYQGGDGNDFSLSGDLLPDYIMGSLSGPTVASCLEDVELALNNSQVGLAYYLLDSMNEVIDGPIVGNGGSIVLTVPSGQSSDSYQLFGAKLSQTLIFDGLDDAVEVPHDASFDFSTGLTIEAWVYANDISVGNHEIWRKEGADAQGRTLLSFRDDGTVLSFGTHTTIDGYTELDVTIDSADFEDQWVHVMAQFDDTSDTMRLFRNGVEIGLKTSLGTLVNSINPQAGYIGSWNGNAEYFNGTITSLRVWDKAVIDLDEQKMLLNNLVTADAVGLVANYPFIENTGMWLTDVSSNENNASIQGASWNGLGFGGVGEVISDEHHISCVADLIFYDGFE